MQKSPCEENLRPDWVYHSHENRFFKKLANTSPALTIRQLLKDWSELWPLRSTAYRFRRCSAGKSWGRQSNFVRIALVAVFLIGGNFLRGSRCRIFWRKYGSLQRSFFWYRAQVCQSKPREKLNVQT